MALLNFTSGLPDIATVPVRLEPVTGSVRKPETIAVFTFESTPDLETYAQELTTALRMQYEGSNYKLSPPKDLTEMKFVFCAGSERADCLATAGKSFGAHKVIYGNIRPNGNGERIFTVSLLDVGSQTIERTFEISLPEEVKDAASLLFTRLTEEEAHVQLSVAESGGYIAPAGASGGSLAVSSSLRPPSRPYRTLMWTAAGVTVGAAIAGSVFLVLGERKEEEHRDVVADLASQGKITGKHGNRNFSDPSTEEVYQRRLENLEDEAVLRSTVGVIGFGVAGISLVATGAFYFLDKRAGHPEVSVHHDGVTVGYAASFW